MTPDCRACGRPVSVVEAAMAAQDKYPIHLACARRRQRAVASGRCGCRTERYARRASAGRRQWLACERCLGSIRQIA